jgi:glycosyltransferase involved in cell wall biosynthesis
MSTTDQPAVSVIMAVRNAERYLSTALDSIAAQTFRNYEIIVVDGDSSDNSRRIAQSYPRTKCLSQNGTGLAHAWNIGIDVSRAPLLAFLDSDDTWPTRKLADQIDYLLLNPETECVIGRVKFVLEPDQPIPAGFKPALLEGSHVAYMPGTSMIRRGVFARLGKFEERWHILSDAVWFARLRESDIVTGILDEVLLTKRVHSNNLSYTTAWPTYRRELIQMLRESIERRRSGIRGGCGA